MIVALFCMVLVAGVGESTAAVELVRAGKPVGAIVVPAQPLSVETYAAQELQYHIRSATLSTSRERTPWAIHWHRIPTKALSLAFTI